MLREAQSLGKLLDRIIRTKSFLPFAFLSDSHAFGGITETKDSEGEVIFQT